MGVQSQFGGNLLAYTQTCPLRGIWLGLLPMPNSSRGMKLPIAIAPASPVECLIKTLRVVDLDILLRVGFVWKVIASKII
jgi:hypothetical protein